MSNQEEIRNLLKEGVEAARAGDRDRAKKLLLQVTDMDSSNERAWFLLATLEDRTDEKQIYLENVLFVNPANEKAQQMLDEIEKVQQKAARRSSSGGGMSNRTRLYIGIGALIVWLILEIVLFSVGSNRRSDATATIVAINSTQTRQAQLGNETVVAGETQTLIAFATEAAEATGAILTETATHGPSNTPTIDPTVLTLPPEATLVPPSDFTDTPAPTTESLQLYPVPPPDQFTGNIITAWGGLDVTNIGFVNLRLYRPGDGTDFTTVGSVAVNDVEINPANGQTLLYIRYFDLTFNSGPERSNLNASQAQVLNDLWQPLASPVDIQEMSYSNDGSKVVFSAISTDSNSREIWLVDFDKPPAPNDPPITKLTSDTAQWSAPSVSPDGSTVVAARIDEDTPNPTLDLWLIDTATLQTTQLTTDGNGFIERYTRFHPDGQSIVYAASPEDEFNPADLIQIPITPNGLAIPVVRTVEYDEIHPVFSPDGNYLAYASNEAGVYNIFIKDLNNDVIYQLTDEEFDPVYPGGWYQPSAVAERLPLVPLPTPVVVRTPSDDEGDTGN